MNNETDLDWLARNVHVWPDGADFVRTHTNGQGPVFVTKHGAACGGKMFTRDQWLARRAELQNKPTEWPKRANWLAQHEDGEWTFYSDSADNPPQHRPDGNWYSDDVAVKCCHSGEILGDWRDTLEKRPEEFKQFTSIEDNQEQKMKQDNGWFERGELPPVGTRCEALSEPDMDWLEVEVIAHRDGFAIVWCSDERCGANCDDPKHFRPIRTEREVLIEIIKETDDTDDRIADAILAAGFSRRDK